MTVSDLKQSRSKLSPGFRQSQFYGSVNDDIDCALTAELRAHRDLICETHL